MKFALFGLLCVVGTVGSTIIDVFEATNGHEPRVAVSCGHVPFHIDVKTGSWVEDSRGKAVCDGDKEEVKRHCQTTYPKLNITNIVEANEALKFNNWCKPGDVQCTIEKEVVPYRCLVDEYEADALMVPDSCKFDHIHDQSKCLSHDQWKEEAKKYCKSSYKMGLRDYGILLSCGTDKFTGVEFVCCPKKHHKKKQHKKNRKNLITFEKAIGNFKKLMPVETKGCDRSTYLTKQTAMEERHRSEIAAVVDEWDEAEKRYNQLKVKDPVAAEEKMKRTLEVFRQTLADLEKESKEEKARLRVEHADCINTQISKNKRDAMINYLNTIQEQPVDAEEILKTVRKFIQVCEHDRVHSLRHFEHVRNRDADKADTLRVELLQHLKDLNKVVNESMSLLNYLPEIAKKFGLTTQTVLKPILSVEEEAHPNQVVLEAAQAKINKHIAKQTKKANEVGDIHQEINEMNQLGQQSKRTDELEEDDDVDDVVDDKPEEKHHNSKVVNIVLGLCSGSLVLMMIGVVVLIIQRRRVTQPRIIIAENNDDREHLVQMQKSGFENPTYKFFYY